jgi:hypothetical protein
MLYIVSVTPEPRSDAKACNPSVIVYIIAEAAIEIYKSDRTHRQGRPKREKRPANRPISPTRRGQGERLSKGP